MTDTSALRATLADQKAELVPVPAAVPANVTLAEATAPLPLPVAPPKVLGGIPHLADLMTLATAIKRTEMVPQVLRNRPDAILAVMMAGAELGVGPMQSLSSIDLIQGRPALSAELMRALVVAQGHKFRLDQSDTEAKVTCRRKEWPESEPDAVFTWTVDDARRAQLTGKDNYKKFPRAMLSARASSEAARAVFPDVIAGMSYTPEEVGEFSPSTHNLSEPDAVFKATAFVQLPAGPEPDLPDLQGAPGPEGAGPAIDVASEADTAPEPPEEPKRTERQELAHGLKLLIDDQPSNHRPVLRAYLRQRYGDARRMTEAQLAEATAIAAGWPETAKDPEDEPPPDPQPEPEELF